MRKTLCSFFETRQSASRLDALLEDNRRLQLNRRREKRDPVERLIRPPARNRRVYVFRIYRHVLRDMSKTSTRQHSYVEKNVKFRHVILTCRSHRHVGIPTSLSPVPDSPPDRGELTGIPDKGAGPNQGPVANATRLGIQYRIGPAPTCPCHGQYMISLSQFDHV